MSRPRFGWCATCGRSSPAGSARPSPRLRPRACRSAAAARDPACWRTCWWPSSAITYRCIASRRSTPARASNSSAPPWPTGSDKVPRCSARWWARWSVTSWLATACMPTTRRCRCWPQEPARPAPGGCGLTCGTSGPMPDRPRQPCVTATPPTAGASTPGRTWPGSAACCRPTAMPGSMGCTTPAALPRRRAGPMCGASSTTSTPQAARRSRKRR